MLFNTPALRVILLTGPRGAAAMRHALKARPWIESVVMDEAMSLRGAFEDLRRRGIERLSCIGGRTLAAPMLDAGLVQDVYLTTGTKRGGEPDTPLYGKPLLAREMVKKRGTGPDEGVTVPASRHFFVRVISNSFGHHLPVTNSRSCSAS